MSKKNSGPALKLSKEPECTNCPPVGHNQSVGSRKSTATRLPTAPRPLPSARQIHSESAADAQHLPWRQLGLQALDLAQSLRSSRYVRTTGVEVGLRDPALRDEEPAAKEHGQEQAGARPEGVAGGESHARILPRIALGVLIVS